MKVNKVIWILLMLAAIAFAGCNGSTPDVQDDLDEEEGEDHSGDVVRLTDEQLAREGVILPSFLAVWSLHTCYCQVRSVSIWIISFMLPHALEELLRKYMRLPATK